MTKQLFVFETTNVWEGPYTNIRYIVNEQDYIGRYRTASQAEIDEAAGVMELRQEYEALLKAARSLIEFSPFYEVAPSLRTGWGLKHEDGDKYGCNYCDSQAEQIEMLIHGSYCPYEAIRRIIETNDARDDAIAACEPKGTP